jgi:hypothetical protein
MMVRRWSASRRRVVASRRELYESWAPHTPTHGHGYHHREIETDRQTEKETLTHAYMHAHTCIHAHT